WACCAAASSTRCSPMRSSTATRSSASRTARSRWPWSLTSYAPGVRECMNAGRCARRSGPAVRCRSCSVRFASTVGSTPTEASAIARAFVLSRRTNGRSITTCRTDRRGRDPRAARATIAASCRDGACSRSTIFPVSTLARSSAEPGRSPGLAPTRCGGWRRRSAQRIVADLELQRLLFLLVVALLAAASATSAASAGAARVAVGGRRDGCVTALGRVGGLGVLGDLRGFDLDLLDRVGLGLLVLLLRLHVLIGEEATHADACRHHHADEHPL